MKTKELREKKDKDLQKILLDFKKEWFNLRFQRASGVLTKGHRLRYIRRSIAKIKTLLNENSTKEVKNA